MVVLRCIRNTLVMALLFIMAGLLQPFRAASWVYNKGTYHVRQIAKHLPDTPWGEWK